MGSPTIGVETGSYKSLDWRRDFWAERFRRCEKIAQLAPPGQELRYLALHAARTRTVDDAWAAYQNGNPQALERVIAGFDANNRRLLPAVLAAMTPFLRGVSVAVDLYCGPGLFTRELKSIVPTVYGMELVDELARQACLLTGVKDIFGGNPLEVLSNITDWKVETFTALRGFLHSPPEEKVEVVDWVVEILPVGGWLFIAETVRDDTEKMGRKTNPGTWYMSILDYCTLMAHRMELKNDPFAKKFNNEGDPLRLMAFQKAR